MQHNKLPLTAEEKILLQQVFHFHPQHAQASGRALEGGGFLVLAGSTALRHSSATKKRNREERDRLIGTGVLVLNEHMDLYVFNSDQKFTSASSAAGVIKDGNASGPQLWIDTSSGKSLRDLKNLCLSQKG